MRKLYRSAPTVADADGAENLAQDARHGARRFRSMLAAMTECGQQEVSAPCSKSFIGLASRNRTQAALVSLARSKNNRTSASVTCAKLSYASLIA